MFNSYIFRAAHRNLIESGNFSKKLSQISERLKNNLKETFDKMAKNFLLYVHTFKKLQKHVRKYALCSV